MTWASHLSTVDDGMVAAEEAIAVIDERLGGPGGDLALLFLSPNHQPRARAIVDRIDEAFPGVVLIGCSGAGIIGGGIETEGPSALSLTVGAAPGALLQPFTLDSDDLPAADDGAAWRAVTGMGPEDRPSFLLLADPFTCEVQQLLEVFDGAYPGCPKVGGLASGARRAGGHLFVCDGEIRHAGAVGLAIGGGLTVDTVVAQGCRPIGHPYFITRGEENLIHELGGRPGQEVVSELVDGLPAEEQELVGRGLFLGLGLADKRDEYRLGDFLIRNLLGWDRDSGALVVGGEIAPLDVVQFQVRDARTSREELDGLLREYVGRRGPPEAALLFSCLGRGVGLYGEPNHDSDLTRRCLGELPIGGFFCSGEIGPVGGRTFLHGYTSSLALLRPR